MCNVEIRICNVEIYMLLLDTGTAKIKINKIIEKIVFENNNFTIFFILNRLIMNYSKKSN